MLSKVRSNKIFKTSKYGESAAKQEENILEDKNREGGREGGSVSKLNIG